MFLCHTPHLHCNSQTRKVQSPAVAPGDQLKFKRSEPGDQKGDLSHEKNPALLSMKYWLVNDGILIMAYEKIPI